jgi:hypothetical protein
MHLGICWLGYHQPTARAMPRALCLWQHVTQHALLAAQRVMFERILTQVAAADL